MLLLITLFVDAWGKLQTDPLGAHLGETQDDMRASFLVLAYYLREL